MADRRIVINLSEPEAAALRVLCRGHLRSQRRRATRSGEFTAAVDAALRALGAGLSVVDSRNSAASESDTTAQAAAREAS